MSQFRRSYQESRIQRAIVVHFRRTYEGRISRVSNDGRKGALQAIRDKEEGLDAGHPDLVAYTPGPVTIHIEVKSETGTLSPAQKAFVRDLRNMGYVVLIVHSLDEAMRAFLELNLPLKQPRNRSEAELITGF